MISLLALAIIILLLAIVLDILMGEPPDIIHPVVFMGITISKLKPRFMGKENKIARGCLFLISILIINTVPLLAVLYILYISGSTILPIL